MDLSKLPSKQILLGTEVRNKMKKGIDKMVGAARVTLGPKGRFVILDREHSTPIVTKDGISCLNEIKFKDPFMNAGAQLVKEVSRRTADAAGDGTTTSAIMAHALFSEGLSSVEHGASPIEIKRGIDKTVQVLVDQLDKVAYPTDSLKEIEQVGAISANNEQWIGELIAEAMDEIGPDGVITVQDGFTHKTFVDIAEGMRLRSGYLSEALLTDKENLKGEYEDVEIIFFNGKLNSAPAFLNLMNKVAEKHPNFQSTTFLLIANSFSMDVIADIEHNYERGIGRVIPVKGIGTNQDKGENMEDIAALTGGHVLGHKGRVDFEVDCLGKAGKVVLTHEHMTILDGAADEAITLSRVDELKAMRDKAPSPYDKEAYSERIARLAGGIAVIHAGGRSDAEIIELKHRIEDALGATQAAVAEGIVPGGGTALAKLGGKLGYEENSQLFVAVSNKDQQLGVDIVKRACEAPFKQILENAGLEHQILLEQVRRSEDWFTGYDAKEGRLTNMKNSGIIDPVRVTKLAIQNAASIAGLLLTTEGMITEDNDD